MLPYPVDAPGYLSFPGIQGNHALFDARTALTSLTTLEYVAYIDPALGSDNFVIGWGPDTQLALLAARKLRITVAKSGGGSIGGFLSNVIPAHDPPEGQVPRTSMWVRAKLTVSSGNCEYWYAYQDDKPEGAEWQVAGSGTGTTGTVNYAPSATVYLGGHPTTVMYYKGKLMYAEEIDSGVSTHIFNGTVDLAGVPPDAETIKPTLAPPKAGGGAALLNLAHRFIATAQGYVSLPGTTGNYLAYPDTLNYTNELTICVRARAIDTTPIRVGVSLAQKGPSFNFTLSPDGVLVAMVKSSGTTIGELTDVDDVAPTLPSTWVWYLFSVDGGTIYGWVSTIDSLTPPPPGTGWTALSDGPVSGSIDNGTDEFRFGVNFEGDLGYVGMSTVGISTLENPGTPAPVLAVLLSADALVETEPPTPLPVQVVSTETPKDSGFFRLPGTAGNNISLPPGTVDVPGSQGATFITRISPTTWRPPQRMAIISLWDPDDMSWSFSLDTDGRLLLAISETGTGDIRELISTTPMVDLDEDAVVYVCCTVRPDAGQMLGRFWTSLDERNWSELGSEVTMTASPVADRGAPFRIGEGFGMPFQGRIFSVRINGGTVDGVPGGNYQAQEFLRLDSEHIPADPDADIFVVNGDTATVNKSPVPVDFGVFRFPGSEGNYLEVAHSPELTFTDHFFAEVRIAPNDWSMPFNEQFLIGKTQEEDEVDNFGWVLSLIPDGSLRFTWSNNGVAINHVDSVALNLRNGFAKYVGFSFDRALGGRFWLSDNNIKWNQWGPVMGLSSTIFASTGPLKIGPYLRGAMTGASLRTFTDTPLQEHSIFLIDQTCLDIAASVDSFTSTPTEIRPTPFTVYITRNPTAVPPGGYLSFPGTEDNDMTVAWDGKPLANKSTFFMRIAPNRWKGTAQTIMSQWAAATGLGFVVQLTDTGSLAFVWTSDNVSTNIKVLEGPVVPDVVDGEFRFLALAVDLVAHAVALYETKDFGNTWGIIGAPVINAALPTTVYAATGPLVIADAPGRDERFNGRISYLAINETSLPGPAPSTDPALTTFLIEPETLRVPSDTTDFIDAVGNDVTVETETTPTTPGYVHFAGEDGEYCTTSVPTLNTTDDFTVTFRARMGDMPSGDRVIIQRWDPSVTTGRSWTVRKAGGANKLTLSLSSDGTQAKVVTATSLIWPDPQEEDVTTEWRWYGVTVVYDTDATVRFWTAVDLTTPLGTPIDPAPEEWAPMGETKLTALTALFNTTGGITIGGDIPSRLGGAKCLAADVSDFVIAEGTATAGTVVGLPGGVVEFGVNMLSYYLILEDAPGFIAGTGQNVLFQPTTGDRELDIEPTPAGPILHIVPSPDGPELTLVPAPPGPVTEIQPPEEDGPAAFLVASPPGETLISVQPSLNRNWWPGSQNTDTSTWRERPAFTVQRSIKSPITGGDYVRGSSNVMTEQAALRFPTGLPGWTIQEAAKGRLLARPIDYSTMKIEWGFPDALLKFDDKQAVVTDNWSEVAIVRSAFGCPSTVNDGQVIFRMDKASLYPKGYQFQDGKLLTPDVFDPRAKDESGASPGLPPGRWYYYTLFFKVQRDWLRSQMSYSLIPRNTGHSDHLWNALPPYYRYLDNEQRSRAGAGDLEKFFAVLGYELDYTRELVESWQDTYHIDWSPVPLLRRVGENFGVPYEPGIGDIRYRALLGRIGFIQQQRGTPSGLRQLIAAASKCDCDLTQSPNTLLLPDDSDFYEGTGNWVPLHDDTRALLSSSPGIPPSGYATAEQVRLGWGLNLRPAVPAGRGEMHVWTAAAYANRNIIVACGDGLKYLWSNADTYDPADDVLLNRFPQEIAPRFSATPVDAGQVYGFSIFANSDTSGVVVRPMILFFTSEGQAESVIAADTWVGTVPTALADPAEWYEISVSAPVSTLATYAVPCVIITARPGTTDSRYPTISPSVHFAGASFHLQGGVSEIATDVPIEYITLAEPGEFIGPPNLPTFPGYLIGEDP